MVTRRNFIKNTVIGSMLIYVGMILSDIKASRFAKRVKKDIYVFSDKVNENQLTDIFFDKI